MVRYLSPGWFERLRELGATAPTGRAGRVVLRHEVHDGPDGHVTYDVVIDTAAAAIDPVADGPADLVFVTDYPTAAAIASGTISTNAALADGRLRVRGDVTILASKGDQLPAGDLVPDQLRAETRY